MRVIVSLVAMAKILAAAGPAGAWGDLGQEVTGLIEDESGALYGAAYGGGAHASGAIFKITRH